MMVEFTTTRVRNWSLGRLDHEIRLGRVVRRSGRSHFPGHDGTTLVAFRRGSSPDHVFAATACRPRGNRSVAAATTNSGSSPPPPPPHLRRNSRAAADSGTEDHAENAAGRASGVFAMLIIYAFQQA